MPRYRQPKRSTTTPLWVCSNVVLFFAADGGDEQDDVVQFLSRLGVEEVETPIGAFNELYR